MYDKTTMKQYEMNFEAKRPEEMTDEELADAYKQSVGVPPRTGVSREMQVAAIQNPEEELQRLRAIDAEDDKVELERNYRR